MGNLQFFFYQGHGQTPLHDHNAVSVWLKRQTSKLHIIFMDDFS